MYFNKITLNDDHLHRSPWEEVFPILCELLSLNEIYNYYKDLVDNHSRINL